MGSRILQLKKPLQMSRNEPGQVPFPVISGALAQIDDSMVRETPALDLSAHEALKVYSYQITRNRPSNSIEEMRTEFNRLFSDDLSVYVDADVPVYNRRESDKNKLKDDTERMEYVPKDLLDAKLEAIEARMDGRVASIESKVDAFLVGQHERDKAFEKVTEQRFLQLDRDVNRISDSAEKVAEQVSGIRITMAKYFGGAIVIGALASAGLGFLLRYIVTG